MNQLITKAVMLAAGTMLLADYANGQTIFNNQDLILGVRVSGGTGFGTDYEIDLGNVSTLNNALTFSSAIGTDLAHEYGRNWLTRSDLFWSVSAVVYNNALPGQVNRTAWVTQQQGSTPAGGSASALATPAGNINSLDKGIGGFNGSAANGASAFDAAFIASSLANSYSGRVLVGAPTVNLGWFNPVEANASVVQDLFQFVPGTAPYPTPTSVGTFQFDGNGSFSFTPTVVPEPSTCQLLAGAGVLALGLRNQYRRRTS